MDLATGVWNIDLVVMAAPRGDLDLCPVHAAGGIMVISCEYGTPGGRPICHFMAIEDREKGKVKKNIKLIIKGHRQARSACTTRGRT